MQRESVINRNAAVIEGLCREACNVIDELKTALGVPVPDPDHATEARVIHLNRAALAILALAQAAIVGSTVRRPASTGELSMES